MRIKLSDLSPGVNYAIQVRAVSGEAFSQWSRVFNLTTSSDTVAPKTPLNVAGSMSGTSFNLSWDAVTQSEDNSPAHDLDHYEVKVESTGTATVRYYAVADTKFLFSLEMNREAFGASRANIKMSVRAVDKVGNGSAYSSIIDQANAAPANPTGFTATPVPDGIVLKWNAVADADLFGYKVYSGTAAGTQTTLVWMGSATSATIPSTAYSTDTWYRVVAYDVFTTESTGTVAGPVRPNSPFTVDSTAPGVPAGLAATLTNATDGKTAKAVVTWTAVTDTDGDLAEYIIDYKPSSETNWNTTKVDYEKTAVTLVGLIPYVNYDFRIRSSDWSANLSNWSAVVTKTATANTAPATVTGVGINAAKDAIIVSWALNTESDMANGAGTYLVEVATNSGFTTGLLSYRTGASTITITGLAQNQIYYARVKAVDSLGLASTAWSTVVNATTGDFPVGSTFKYWPPSSTAPSTPSTGDLWMDTATGLEKQYNGTVWVATGNATIKYVASKGTDLITNGTGLMNNNYNFSTFTFNPADSPEGSSGSFIVDTTAVTQARWLDENVPVDPAKPYLFSFMSRQTMAGGAGRIYGAISPLDAAGSTISTNHYTYLASTDTTLAAPLNPGDTTITLTSSANWRTSGASTQFANVWNWTDQFGKVWKQGTYTRNSLPYASIAGNVVTLNSAYAGAAMPAGTPISNGNSGGSYMYIGAANALVPETWTRYSGMLMAGVHDGSAGTVATTRVPQGTAFVKVGFLANYNTTAGTSKIAFANVSLSDAAAAQTTADSAIATADGKNKIVRSTSDASGTSGYVTNDVWWKLDGSGNVIKQWKYVAGTGWVAEVLMDGMFGSVSANKLVAGSAFVVDLDIGAGGIIKSAGYTDAGTSGFKLSTSGLIIKGSGNFVSVDAVSAGTISAKTWNVGTGGVINVDATGVIKSNNYAAGSTGYQLSNTGLEINDGSVDAKVLKTNSAVIGDLIIGRSADALGTIRSFDYSAGTAGWKIGKGLFEINNGLIKAAALQLQTSPNLMPPQFADFEYQNDFYISSFWKSTGQGGMSVSGGAADGIAVSAVNRFKGTRALSLDSIGGTGTLTAWFGTSSTDYNISLEPGKTYIWSAYIKNRQASAQTWTFSVKGDNGATIGTQAFALGASEAAMVRRSFAFTVPAGVNAGIVSAVSTAGAASAIYVDGMQLEEKTGADNTPSVWSPPGSTTMNGAGITTGMLRSSQNITIAGVDQPVWSLNTAGNLQIGDALIRGKMVVGTTTEALPNRAPNGGNFETNVTGYQVYHVGATGTAIARTTTGGEVITGTGSAKVTAAAGDKSVLGISFNTAQTYLPGTTVTISANLKTNAATAGSVLGVSMWNSTLAAVATGGTINDPVANNIYPINFSYTVQEGEDVATIILYQSGTGLTTTSFIVDDIIVTADNEIGTSYIQSANYSKGNTGWKIDGNGNPEFNNGIFRGTLGAGMVTAETLSSVINISNVFRAGDETGKRVIFSPDGIQSYRADNSMVLNIPTDDSVPASIDGDFLASSLTISDQMAIRGTNNELSRGATLTVQSGTTAPSSPPTVSIGWDSVPIGDGTVDGFSAARQGATFQGGWVRVPLTLYGGGVYIESFDVNTGARTWGSIDVNHTDGMWVAQGITSIVDKVFLLGQRKDGSWRIMGFNLTTAYSGLGSRFLDVSFPYQSYMRKPSIGNDGTNLVVGYTHTSNNLLYQMTFSATTGAKIGSTVTSNLTKADDVASINKGVFDNAWGTAGAPVFVVTFRNDTNAYVFDASMQRLSGLDFPLPAKPSGQFWANNAFYTSASMSGRTYKHTGIQWNSFVTGASTWHIGTTWYDGDATGSTHETTVGPLKTFTMKKRARLTVTTPPYPIRPVPNTTDDATASGIYLSRQASVPARTNLERLTYTADGVRTFVLDSSTPLPGVGATASQPPPLNSNFPASTPGTIRTDNDRFFVRGDGSGGWAGIVVDTLGAINVPVATTTNIKIHKQDYVGGTTDASGFLTFTHTAGFTPTAAFVTMRAPASTFAMAIGADSFSSTSCRVRFSHASSAALYTSASTGAFSVLFFG